MGFLHESALVIITRVRFPSPAPLSIKSLRISASGFGLGGGDQGFMSVVRFSSMKLTAGFCRYTVNRASPWTRR